MDTAKIGYLKRAVADLSFENARDAYALDRELRKPVPRKTHICRINARIAENKERIRIMRERIAELEHET